MTTPRRRANVVTDVAAQVQATNGRRNPKNEKPAQKIFEDRPGFASVNAVEDAVLHLTDKFLECRDLGHNWRPLNIEIVADQHPVYYRRVIRCVRCRTEREIQLDRRGHKLNSNYDYTDGYLIPGLGRIAGEAKDALRLEAINRELGRQ